MTKSKASHLLGKLKATSIVTKNLDQSLDFYTQALGYKVLDKGQLSNAQKNQFGQHLDSYIIVGHDRDCVIRLIESTDKTIDRNRRNARPYDIGMCVMEAGAANVDAVYSRLIEARYGCITPPKVFAVDGPEPLGYVEMKAVGVFGPSGEQMFITQITDRKGGTPLWDQRSDINVFPPGNVVISLKDRSIQDFYAEQLGLYPETDLKLDQQDAFKLMGGPPEMAFDMCLMGNGDYKSGIEQHVYGAYNPNFDFKYFPCDYKKSGLASACWQADDLESLRSSIEKSDAIIIGNSLLPFRGNPEPEGLVFQGPAGEIIELFE